MTLRAALLLTVALTACAPAIPPEATTRSAVLDVGTLPPVKSFASRRAEPPRLSNADLRRDFLDLTFQLESGRSLPVFTRFEGPITVRVTGAPPASLNPDLSALLGRLRSEAGIDIRRVPASASANITVEAVRRSEIRRALPQAACFVVPNVTSLREYRAQRRSPSTNWALLRSREKLAIFLPNDVSPQEVRDCLHEELAQALGPLNDLYRLPNSVFNDDNVHTVLTGFDMLILRMIYAPELRNGLTRKQVEARLAPVLARLNPGGAALPARPARSTTRGWINAVQDALGPGTSPANRRAAAAAALRIATQEGWDDHRLAFAHYITGRLMQAYDPGAAQARFDMAVAIYNRTPDTALHRAYVSAQTAAYAIGQADGRTALRILGPALEAARQGENAALLSTLMLLQAEALALTGQTEAARQLRLDSLGWARYGFGSDWAVRARVNEIAALNPQN